VPGCARRNSRAHPRAARRQPVHIRAGLSCAPQQVFPPSLFHVMFRFMMLRFEPTLLPVC
jgi:hypothetical protein